MKYLFLFIILAFAIFISLTETKRSISDREKDEKSSDKKWKSLDKKSRQCSVIAKLATKKYNFIYHTHYNLWRITLAEKAVGSNLKIRVFFKACDKTCSRHLKNKRNKRKPRRHRKTCNIFRATFERISGSKEPIIHVKNLDRDQGTGKHEAKKSPHSHSRRE
uniref:Uncharacterized protein n=1 Tax=Strongyloides papillosus TaxID=174720 RepID=A0A0N5BHP8_STREA